MAKDSRGKRPKGSRDSYPVPAAPINHDEQSPKFCLHFLAADFDVHALHPEKQAAFAKTLQKLASSRWIDLCSRHGTDRAAN